MNFLVKYVSAIGSAIAIPVIVFAGEWSGYVTAETRDFESAPQFGEQKEGTRGAIIFEPEYYVDWEGGDRTFEFSPYFRTDTHDSERRMIDIRELSFESLLGSCRIAAPG